MDAFINFALFILGGFTVIIYQYYQSKEVLKQIIYKEKLDFYSRMIGISADLQFDLLGVPNLSEENKKKIRKGILELQHLILKSAHIISFDAYDQFMDYGFNARRTMNNETSEDKMSKSFGECIKSVRKELGIKILSKEIEELYSKFPIGSLLKSKNKN